MPPSHFAPSSAAPPIRRILPSSTASASRRPRSPHRATSALRSSRTRLGALVAASLVRARAGALRTFGDAGAEAWRRRDVVAVTLVMGAAAAGGDREEAFDSAVAAMSDGIIRAGGRGVSFVRLTAEWHGSVVVAAERIGEACERVEDGGVVIVGMEDAEHFPEDVVRDIVYLCGRRCREGGGEEGRVRFAIMFGVSISGESVRSALGVTESAMIAPVTITMPSAEICFHHVVQGCLAGTEMPIVLSAPVFRMLRDEFFRGDASVAMLRRSLDDIYSIHFWDRVSELKAVFSNWGLRPPYLSERRQVAAGEESDAIGQGAEVGSGLDAAGSGIVGVEELLDGNCLSQFANGDGVPSVLDSFPEDSAASITSAAIACRDALRQLKPGHSEDEEKVCLEGLTAHKPVLHDLAHNSLENLCHWRWLHCAVQEVTWDLAEELNISEEDAKLPACWSAWNVAVKDGHVKRMRLRATLYEQFLPDVGLGRADGGDKLSAALSGCDSRKTILRAIRVKMGRLSFSSIESLLISWQKSLGRQRSSAGPSLPEELHLAAIEDGLQKMRTFIAVSQAEGLDDTPGEGDEKLISAPRPPPPNVPTPAERRGRSSFDDAFTALDAGSGVRTSNRRASGGIAKKAHRMQMLVEGSKAASVASSGPLIEMREKLQKLFEDMLELVRPISELTLHEVVVFRDWKELVKHSGGMSRCAQPRSSFIEHLRGTRKEQGSGLDIDIGVAYRLLTECGSMVNVPNWFGSYQMVRNMSSGLLGGPLDANGDGDLNDGDDDAAMGSASGLDGMGVFDSNADMSVRSAAEFSHVYQELQHLGFVKPTKRRADHVIRLVFE